MSEAGSEPAPLICQSDIEPMSQQGAKKKKRGSLTLKSNQKEFYFQKYKHVQYIFIL